MSGAESPEAIKAAEARAQQRIAAFEARGGVRALAVCAAFPMTLTTDVVCCLRENFVADAPWYSAADVLLGLCESIGHDLYEMPGGVRRHLLQDLRSQPQQVTQLEEFMLSYIGYRLGLAQRQGKPTVLRHAKLLGQDPLPQWTALACLGQESKLLQQIRAYLLAQVDDAPDRLYWMAMVQSFGEQLLPGTPILQWAERLEAGQDLDELARVERSLGVSLKPIQFETARLRFGQPSALPDPTARQAFEFTTARIGPRGGITRRTQQTWGYVERLTAELGLDMVAIAGGSFEMGSPPDELQRYDDESPQHRVVVPPFFMGRYTVTQAQWKVVAGWEQVDRELSLDPAAFKGENHPVEQVSWQDATEFCQRLARETGRLYGLPSEAEWEYACRAGTTTPFHFGETIDTELANYSGNYVYGKGKKGVYLEKTTPVGSFPANEWGLHDLHGNVWEWCEDHWHDNYKGAPVDGSAWVDKNAETEAGRVFRGGSWIDLPRYCRSASRFYPFAGLAYDIYGFRVVCRLPRT
jgi:formylglycine-generating enzyme required for sulfatase activity